MATNHSTHRSPSPRRAGSSRQKRCSRPLLTLAKARFVELDAAHESAAIGALADLLTPDVVSGDDGELLTCGPDGGHLGGSTPCPKEGSCQ